MKLIKHLHLHQYKMIKCLEIRKLLIMIFKLIKLLMLYYQLKVN